MQSLGLAGGDPGPHSAPAADAVRAELERILSSIHFQASERRRTFLRFIVEETLSGRAGRLKGYSVAVAVFGRDETFDPRSDPVVRLEARRLRRDLDCYYVDAGSSNPLRISIPKGSYVPRFEWNEAHPRTSGAEQETSTREPSAGDAPPASQLSATGRFRGGRVEAVALALAIVAIAAIGWLFTAESQRPDPTLQAGEPALVVLPFEALDPADDSRYLATGISQELVSNLMRFPGFRLYTLPTTFREDEEPEPVELGRDLGVAYVVSGTVRAGAEEVRVAAQMLDAVTNQVLWTGSYDRPLTPKSVISVQSDLAGEIATVLGQPYGVVNADLNTRAATPAVSSMQSYLCVLRAYGYRRSFSEEEFGPVLGCLEEAVQRDRDYSEAWAMLGWLHLDAGRYDPDERRQDEYEQALSAATRAVTLEPGNVLALKVLAAINHYMGRYDEGERLARQALERNPHDPDTLAQLGWRLAVRGRFEEGISLLKRAIERSVNPPGWYFHLVAIDLLLKEDYAQMLGVAERSAVDGSAVSQALIAIASGELGNGDAARRALEKMAAFGPLAHDPAAYFRRHGATDQIVDALTAGLRKAQQVALRS